MSMPEQQQAGTQLTLFYSYAHKDEALRQELEKHLSILHRQGLISSWHDRQIVPGTDWAQAIDTHLETASLILLLISADFLASDYCYGIEMKRALERYRLGDAHVIPIILRSVDWADAPFADLQCLPRDGRSVSEWEDQDMAFREISRGIRHVAKQLCGNSLRLSVSRTHRQRLLKRVYTHWIDGVLEQSLYREARIQLGLHKQPDALVNPWHLTLQEMHSAPHPLPLGTRITKVYDDADGEVLILGEPGAGKTTLLLELARDLLERAKEEVNHPMPVIFNLSSWAIKRLSLETWLREELSARYGCSHKVATTWINEDQMIVLLDGLDEVAPDARSACVQAINTYQRAHELASIVVCSRSIEYFTQKKRLLLQQAVTIQPLTAEQIEMYLSQLGERLNVARQMLQDDLWLRELITTPLMLSIFILTYQGKSAQDLPVATPLSATQFEQTTTELRTAYARLLNAKPATQEAQQALTAVQTTAEQLLLVGHFAARRRYLFARYAERMLQRRSPGVYTPQTTIQGLSWLAKTLVLNDQVVFSPGMRLKKLPNPLSPMNRFIATLLWLFPITLSILVGLGIIFYLLVRNFGSIELFSAGLLVIGSLLIGRLGWTKFKRETRGNREYRTAQRYGIKDWALRWSLSHAGVLPRNYQHFLDHATDHILLHKVGLSYIFIHRLLLDYFASLETATPEEASASTVTHNLSVPLSGRLGSAGLSREKRVTPPLLGRARRPSRGERRIAGLLVIGMVVLLLVCNVSIFSFVRETAQKPFQAEAAFRTAVATNPYPTYMPGHGTLTFYDPLLSSSSWQDLDGACHSHSQSDGLRVTQTIAPGHSACFSYQPSIGGSFAFEVHMTILKGDCGGLSLWGPPYFIVCHTGTVYLSEDSNITTPSPIYNVPGIKQDYGTVNTLAVLIGDSNVSFYVNGQLIQILINDWGSYYELGVISDARSGATDVVYSNAKIWTMR